MTSSLASKTNSPAKKAHIGGKTALVVHRGIDGQVVFEARLIVLLAVAGRGVNGAGSGVEGEVFREDQHGFPVKEGMAGLEAFEVFRGIFAITWNCFFPPLGHDLFQKGFGQDPHFAVHFGGH